MKQFWDTLLRKISPQDSFEAQTDDEENDHNDVETSDDDFNTASSSDESIDSDVDSNGPVTATEDIYEPIDGVESDDDLRECCHWSTEQVTFETIESNPNCDEYRKPARTFPDDKTQANILELVLDTEFQDICIDATNEHAEHDDEYMREIGILQKNEQGRSLLKGFLAIKWHFWASLGIRRHTGHGARMG